MEWRRVQFQDHLLHTMINIQLFQQHKALRKGEFDHLTIIITLYIQLQLVQL